MRRDHYVSPRLRRTFSAFAAVAALTGVAVQLLTAPGTIRAVSTFLLFTLAIVVAVLVVVPELLRQHRAARSLPSDAQLESLTAAYRIDQATSDEIGWIAQLEASVYSAEDAIPEHVLQEWFAVNPNGFSILKTGDGQPAGHVDILPLRPATLQAFSEGRIVEREIRGDSLYSPRDRRSIRSYAGREVAAQRAAAV